MPWLLAKTLLGLPRLLWILIALVAVVVGLMVLERSDDKGNQEIGANKVRVESAAVNAERVEKGNEAREEIRSPGATGDCKRFAQCVRSAREGTSASCGRFLPEQSSGIGCPSPN